jgi:HSP20 family protein
MSLVRRSSAFNPFSMDLWDPFNNMFRSVVPSSSGDDMAAFAAARVDWKETSKAHVFKADLPGVQKEEVKVEVEDGGVLVISCQRSVRIWAPLGLLLPCYL